MSESDLTFTGERLHAEDALFGIDLLRHRAAYQEAIRRVHAYGARWILELGSGTGYGMAEMAEALPNAKLVAVDRVAPLAAGRASVATFLRADLRSLPLEAKVFDFAISFQVIEHLEDPKPYLASLADRAAAHAEVLISTPNADFSDGENPFHIHEYTSEELRETLLPFFEEVEMLGVSATGEALKYHEDRLARIRRIVRIDPLGLRRRLPTALVEFLFARLALIVRRGVGAAESLPRIALENFPIEKAHVRSLDLFAVCRGPKHKR